MLHMKNMQSQSLHASGELLGAVNTLTSVTENSIKNNQCITERAKTAANAYCGILCGSNSVSGIIENFVVKNCLTEDKMPFCVYVTGGLVCGTNYGMVRNGYVYGENIYSDVQTNSNGAAINVGGIVGSQGASGTTMNVYSLVNVTVPSPGRNTSQKAVSSYGSVIGNATGRLSNVYGIGQSMYSQAYNGTAFDETRGPVAGTNGSRNANVYYWNEDNFTYTGTLSKGQQRIGVETLYDYSWQSALLGQEFKTNTVEVGYYPQVLLSSELPNQEFIPLPGRAQNRIVDVMSMTLLEYTDNDQAAIVEVRLSNPMNASITALTMENLTAEIIDGTVESADGYTTLQMKVSNPTRFCSSYELQEVKFYLNSRNQVATYDPAPVLLADFYRPIYNADDWYNYVVKAPTENARLMNDIDFTGVAQNRICVTSTYSGKLSGGGTPTTSGYSLQNITLPTVAYVFVSVTGTVKDICVDNFVIGSQTKPQTSPAFISSLYGYATNVHMGGVTIYGNTNVGSLVSTSQSASVITNCSARDVVISYLEPDNTNTTGKIGGLVGYAYYCHIDVVQ